MNRSTTRLRVSLSLAAATFISTPTIAISAPTVEVATSLRAASTEGWKSIYDWGRLWERVSAWANLPADWDGVDGQAPTAATVASAHLFLDQAQLAGLDLPSANLAGDGEITFHWSKGDDVTTVSFLSDGNVVAFARCGGVESLSIDEPCNATVTTRLIDRLARLQ